MTAEAIRTQQRPRLAYDGELGTDLWALSARWGKIVAGPWQRTVAGTFDAVQAEAERRATQRASPGLSG